MGCSCTKKCDDDDEGAFEGEWYGFPPLCNVLIAAGIAIVGSMTTCVASEDKILVMRNYSEEEERLHDPIAAIQESVHKIRTAFTISGLATSSGSLPYVWPHFRSSATSGHPPSSQPGSPSLVQSL